MHQSSLHPDSGSLAYKRLTNRDFSPTRATHLIDATFSQDEIKTIDNLHEDDEVRRTNSPPSSHIPHSSSFENHGFDDEVEKAMKIHIDSLLRAQDLVSDTIVCFSLN